MIPRPNIDLLRPKRINPGSSIVKPCLLIPRSSIHKLSFGSSSYLDCGEPSSLTFERTDSFTFLFWVKVPVSISFINCFFGKTDVVAQRGYTFYLDDIGRFWVWLSSNTGNQLTPVYDYDRRGLDAMYAVTYNGNSTVSGVSFFLDGELKPYTVLPANNLTGTILTPGKNFYIGAVDTGLNWSDGIKQLIAYNRVLSVDEVRKYWSDPYGQPDTHGLISYWPFQEGYGSADGTQIRDYWVNQNHGSMQGFSGNPWTSVGVE